MKKSIRISVMIMFIITCLTSCNKNNDTKNTITAITTTIATTNIPDIAISINTTSNNRKPEIIESKTTSISYDLSIEHEVIDEYIEQKRYYKTSGGNVDSTYHVYDGSFGIKRINPETDEIINQYGVSIFYQIDSISHSGYLTINKPENNIIKSIKIKLILDDVPDKIESCITNTDYTELYNTIDELYKNAINDNKTVIYEDKMTVEEFEIAYNKNSRD